MTRAIASRITLICTYDPSGRAWCDPPPGAPAEPPASVPACRERVEDLRHVLRAASVSGPYVLVGFSIGGLYARLFALLHPDDVAGMVIVDHAFIDPGGGTPPACGAESAKPGVLN